MFPGMYVTGEHRTLFQKRGPLFPERGTGKHRTLFQKKGPMFPGLLLSPPLLPNSGRDIHHCMSLPFEEEVETSENPTQSIDNIVMTTEEAVNEALIRQRFIRPT